MLTIQNTHVSTSQISKTTLNIIVLNLFTTKMSARLSKKTSYNEHRVKTNKTDFTYLIYLASFLFPPMLSNEHVDLGNKAIYDRK